MEGFSFASKLDINMGTIYYHIKLDADAQKLCTTIFLWDMGKYKYEHFPMVIKLAWIMMFSKLHV
jgi:hypothetical protein